MASQKLAFLLIFPLLVAIVNCRTRPMGELLQRAIERTKQFQSTDRDKQSRPILTQTAIKQRQLQPIRLQRLDVPKLNGLLKTLDKSWIRPKPGVFEPVGSNFQYKKTCASIYKARPNACDQLGFGVMCFNFCYEQGEALEFRCEDASDAQFCKRHANYDQFLSKHRKDGYRAKAYIHQQLTRCYKSSVCNGALLNTSLIRTSNNFAQLPLHLRALRNRPRAAVNNVNAEELDGLFAQGANGLERRRQSTTLSTRQLRPIESAEGNEEEEMPKKYVPFWQKLLVRKKAMEAEQKKQQQTLPPELTIEEDAEAEEQRWLEKRFGQKLSLIMSEQQRRREKVAATTQLAQTSHNIEGEADEGRPRLAGTLSMEPVGFWNKFQPGKWFQSVHYITNTG